MFSLVALGFSVVASLGVFGFGEYLKSVEKSKSAQLAEAEASISGEAVEDFIRSRDRFIAADGILDAHVAISNFFTLLEDITLVNVRYSGFNFGTLEDGTAEITLSGTARSFNALAAQSAIFSKEQDIRRAIFSGIDVDEDGTVSFEITAELDRDLLAFRVADAQVAPPPPVETIEEPVSSTVPSTATSTPSQGAPSGSVTPPQL